MRDSLEEKRIIRNALLISATSVIIIWLIWGINELLGIDPGVGGIYPRKWDRLWSIFTAPFFHAEGWKHISSNTAPLFVLTAAIWYLYKPIALKVSLMIYVFTGLWVWASARPAFHIGASGVIYGYAFFVFFSGVFRKDTRAIALALVVALLYGSLLWGIFPGMPGVSWESHLFGGVAGTLAAYWYRKKGLEQRKKYDWELREEEDEGGVWNYRVQDQPPPGFKYPEEN